ncbi:hypothetical protein AERO8C_160263 [Aeromonas veronii]|uniref:Uncharacterized protein n=1 Tax=Aeromonas veronii TaxID=654 RepID=A0A653KY09_AERVE|nr:hypothetical protein AERO8C_160263 [Aeromonas veronii]
MPFRADSELPHCGDIGKIDVLMGNNCEILSNQLTSDYVLLALFIGEISWILNWIKN